MRTALASILLFALAAGANAADVRLKSTVRVEPGLPVRLSDVALIDGKDADLLGSLVVIDDPGATVGTRRWLTVTPEDITKAMRANSIAPSRHTINGRAVRVRLVSDPTPRATPTPAQEAQPETVDLSGPETVRSRVARTLALRYGVDNDNLRLLFEPEHEPLLGRTLAGLTPVVRPISSANSDRLRIEIRLVAGERVVASGTITGVAQIKKTVAIPVVRVEKGTLITREHLRADTRWLDPSVAANSVSIDQALGLRASNRLDPNTLVSARDIEAPLAVRRNGAVSVLIVGGGVSIETRARALRDAREGERVMCRLDRGSEPFEGVVTGPGQVLVNLDAGTQGATAQDEGAAR